MLAFARRADGLLEQLRGPAGCVSDVERSDSCAHGQVLSRASAVAVSPDGRHLYASAVEPIGFSCACGRELGSLAAALGGLDALVFTGGVGENAAPIRAAVCRDAAWLGIELDGAANDTSGPRLSTAGSRAAAWVVRTDEERIIAAHTRRLLEL